MKITNYSKFIVAVLGAGIATALEMIAPDTDLFTVLKIAAAMLTAAGVFLVPNTQDAPAPAVPKYPADFSDIQLANDDGPKHRL
jgi:hypothetical protein